MGFGRQQNGYFSRLDVYTGRKGKKPEHGLGARVVLTLTSDFKLRWHRVFFNNFFTSKGLMCELEKNGIYGCGTARKDRKGFPAKLKTKKTKVEEEVRHII